MEVHVLYKEFRDRSAAVSGMVRYLETLLKIVNILKNLISADREENWKDHLQAIQETSFLSSILALFILK